MRDFILSDITGGNKAPFSKRSLEHLNEMTSELNSLMFESISDYSSFGTEFVIVKGCVISGSMPGAITWTAGIVYYLGDLYRVDAGGTTIAVGQTAVWNYVDTYISGDPATYSDTNTYNFHRIRKMTLTSAASGSGLKDYNAVKLYTKTSNNSFAVAAFIGVVSAVTINTQYLKRVGNRIDFYFDLSVTTSSADSFSVRLSLNNSDEYPINDTLFYNNSYGHIGSVSISTSPSGNLATGYTRAEYNGNVVAICYRTSNATSHIISASGSYFTEKPYSPY